MLVELIRTYLDGTGATLTEQARKTVTVGTEDLNVALNIIPTKLLTYFFDYEQYYKESHRICALGKNSVSECYRCENINVYFALHIRQ